MSIRYSAADLISTMVELETHGEAFYTAAARNTNNLAARDLFTRLAGEEDIHRAFYESLRERQHEDVQLDDDYAAFLQDAIDSRFTLDPDAAAACPTLADALDIAVALEKDALLFLNEFGPLMGESHQADLEAMKMQERGHLSMVQKFRKDAGL
jgi:rubrerythrin